MVAGHVPWLIELPEKASKLDLKVIAQKHWFTRKQDPLVCCSLERSIVDTERAQLLNITWIKTQVTLSSKSYTMSSLDDLFKVVPGLTKAQFVC